MRKPYLIFIITFFSLTNSLLASKVNGHISNCQGIELKLYTLDNFITGENIVIDSCIVDSNDYFEFTINNSEICVYHINIGKYNVQIVLNPNQNLTIQLPDYTPLSKKEYLNPYFEKEVILVYNDSINDLNQQIQMIETVTATQLKNVLESKTPDYTAFASIDTITSYIESLDLEFLKNYLIYSSTFFHQISQPERKDIIKELYFQTNSPLLNVPTFTQTFLSEYIDPFIAPDGLFYDEISEAFLSLKIDTNFIHKVASTHKIKNTLMAQLIAIKGFYDASIYAPEYDYKIVELLTQLEYQINNLELKNLCHSTCSYIKRTMIGSPAPYYELYTLNGKKVPTTLKRKFVLLAFINSNIYDCQEHLKILEKLKTIYNRDIEIVIINAYQNKKDLERFLSRNEFNDLFFVLWDNNETLLFDYQIKTLPTYYLIDNQGNFAISPLSLPNEGMINELQDIIGY